MTSQHETNPPQPHHGGTGPTEATGVTGDAIRRAGRRLGLAGRPLCVHSSLRSFGRVEGGAAAVVDGLLAEACTVLVPAFSYGYAVRPPADPRLRPARNGWDYRWGDDERRAGAFGGADRVYTPESRQLDGAEMGAIPAEVVGRPERVRGNHPLNSFAAVGPLATGLVSGQTPADVYAPLRALAAAGGWVLLMGVGLNRMTLLHLAEQQAGRSSFLRWANGPDGRPVGVTTGGCGAGFPRLEPFLSPLGRETWVGGSRWRAFPAHEVIEAAAAAIRADPAITHCGRPDCPRCDDAVAGGPSFTVA